MAFPGLIRLESMRDVPYYRDRIKSLIPNITDEMIDELYYSKIPLDLRANISINLSVNKDKIEKAIINEQDIAILFKNLEYVIAINKYDPIIIGTINGIKCSINYTS